MIEIIIGSAIGSFLAIDSLVLIAVIMVIVRKRKRIGVK